MSAPSVEPDQPGLRRYPAAWRSAAQDGKPDLAKLAKGFALISSALALVTVGIVIGNAARKRMDRLAHGLS
jgi:hypothetical protein